MSSSGLPRTTRALLAAAALVLSSTAVAHAGVSDPMLGAPEVGSCYDMTLQEASGDHEVGAPVACRVKHTTQVIAVKKLPADLTWSSDSNKIMAAIYRGCDNALENAVGSSLKIRYRSQYAAFSFVPTDEQKDQGARWYSCHVAVQENDRLGPLPRKLPQLQLPLPNSVARCVTGLKRYTFTTCADDHQWRSSFSTFVFKRPTDANIDRATKRICPRHVSSRAWLWSTLPVSRSKFLLACYTKTQR